MNRKRDAYKPNRLLLPTFRQRKVNVWGVFFAFLLQSFLFFSPPIYAADPASNKLLNNRNTKQLIERFVIPEKIGRYKEELKRLDEKKDELGVGFIKRDEKDDYLISACLPEESLSNEVLEKWYSTFEDFANSRLECINFSEGAIS